MVIDDQDIELGSFNYEATGGCPAGSLYGESLSLTAYVAGNYSTGTRPGQSLNAR